MPIKLLKLLIARLYKSYVDDNDDDEIDETRLDYK